MAKSVAVAPPAGEDLLGRFSELKQQLVAFSYSKRFSRELGKALKDSFGEFLIASEKELASVLDHFILQHRLRDGRTVVDHFVSAHPLLPEADRQMLLGWRGVVEGIFEIRARKGDTVTAVNLIDEMTYVIRSNAGPGAVEPMRRSLFMIARVVPVGTGWMFSGAQELFPASERAAMLRTAAELAMEHPGLVFRNPEKVAKGWELQRYERDRFVEFFGSDTIILPGSQISARLNEFRRWYTREVVRALPGKRVATAHDAPVFEFPEALMEADTVGVIYDETEGLTLLANSRLVQEAFENPDLATDREHRRAVLGYLKEDSISALPIRRLAEFDTARASLLFQRLLKRPAFSWDRDGEALLRKHKPHCFGTQPQPCMIPFSDELAAVIRASG